MALARAAKEWLGSAVSSEAGRTKAVCREAETSRGCAALLLPRGAGADASCSCCFLAILLSAWWLVFRVGGWPGGRSGGEAKSLMPGRPGPRRDAGVTSLCPLETTRSLPGYCGGGIFGTGEGFLIFCVTLQVLI